MIIGWLFIGIRALEQQALRFSHTQRQAQLSMQRGVLLLSLSFSPASSCITVFLCGDQEVLTTSVVTHQSELLTFTPSLTVPFHVYISSELIHVPFVTQGSVLLNLILVIFFFF